MQILSVPTFLGMVLVFVCTAGLYATEVDPSFGDMPVQEDKSLLFRASLNGTVTAEVAAGEEEPLATTIADYVAGRGDEPDAPKAAVVNADHWVRYDGEANLNAPQGTVTFWVQALEWAGNDAHSRYFFIARGVHEPRRDGWMAIYKAGQRLVVAMSRRNGGEAGVNPTVATAPIADWAKGSWHLVGFAWSPEACSLYVDGRRAAERKLTDLYRPEGFAQFLIGGFQPWVPGGEQIQSAIRDVTIFARPLSENQMRALAQAQGAEPVAAAASAASGPMAMIAPTDAPPTVDGDLSDAAWDRDATTLFGFIDNTHRRYAADQTHVFLTYDARNLYVAFRAALGEGADLEQEQLLLRLRSLTGESLRLVITPQGGAVEAEEGVRCATRVESKDWSAELAIPFAALDAAPPGPGEAWRAGFARQTTAPLAYTSWTYQRMVDFDRSKDVALGTLVFDPSAPIIQVQEWGDLADTVRHPRLRYRLRTRPPEQLYLFSDVNVDGRDYRLAHTEKADATAFVDIDIAPGEPGTSPELKSQSVIFSLLNPSFDQTYYRSARLPTGDAPPVVITAASFEDKATLRVSLDTTALRADQLDSQLVIELRDAKNALIAESPVPDLAAVESAVEFSLDRLEPGKPYTVRAVLRDAQGKPVADTARGVTLPDVAQWKDNRIGFSDTPPAPWTAVAVKDQDVVVWGRRYRFEPGSGFPQQIVTRGESILAAPIRLVATMEGGDQVEGRATGAFGRVNDLEAHYGARSEGRRLGITYETTVEYDGMIRTDITLDPRASSKLEQLYLEIPIKASFARYLGVTESVGGGPQYFSFYGNRPDDWATRFYPFVWLGDEDRGLLWFCESARGWHLKNPDRALVIEQDSDQVTLRVNLIDIPQSLAEPLTFTFGLQASPVRPRPARWRLMEKDWVSFPTDTAWYGSVPHTLETHAEKLEKWDSEGRKIVPYTFLNTVSTRLPVYNYFYKDWRRDTTQAKGQYFVDSVCPTIKSWQDYIVWTFHQSLENAPIDGLYYDLVWPSPCRNVEHGCGWVDDHGKVQPRYPIFGLREIAKRVYTDFRSKRDRTYFVGHCSSNPIVLPILSFTDMMLDGEQFAHELHSYTEQVPLERWRAEFTCRQFGPAPLFLPELGRSGNPDYNATTPGPTVEMAMLAYLHDALIWPIFSNGVLGRYQAARQAFFQRGEIEFIPYWSVDSPLRSDNESIKVSAYQTQGDYLIVVGNLAAEAVEATVTFDPARLNIASNGSPPRDALTREPLPLSGSAIPVAVEARSMRLILIESD